MPRTATPLASPISSALRHAAAYLVIVMFLGGVARADSVSSKISDLNGAGDYKVRLSAAIGLTNEADQRAVVPMTKALGDSDKNVRAAAATGLGKLITSATKSADKTRALTELDRLAAGDSSPVVKGAARKAAVAIRALGGATSSGGIIKGGVYVDVLDTTSATGVGSKTILSRMTGIATKEVSKQSVMSTGIMTSWPGTKPDAKALSKQNVDGFQLTISLTKLSTAVAGASATVKCEVKVILATSPAASMFAFLNSSASVQVSNTPSEINAAGEDCVDAVIGGLVPKAMQAIKTRTGKP